MASIVFFNDKPLRQYEDITADDEYQAVDPAELDDSDSDPAKPCRLRAFLIAEEPKVSVVPRFLSPSEAANLMSLRDPTQKIDPKVFGQIQQRLSAVTRLPQSHMLDFFVSELRPDMFPSQSGVSARSEDGLFTAKVVFIFLNEVAEGGELRFRKLGLQIRPREGCAVVWAPCTDDGDENPEAEHIPIMPRQGTRYSAQFIFRNAPVLQQHAA